MSHAKPKSKEKRRYLIIEFPDNKYSVKELRFGMFYFYIRTKFRKIIFNEFIDVVKYVHQRKKEDNERAMQQL